MSLDTERLYRARIVRAVDWITTYASRMAEAGKSAQDISKQLWHMQGAIERWRDHDRFLPSPDPPWEWNKDEWAKYNEKKANQFFPDENCPEPESSKTNGQNNACEG